MLLFNRKIFKEENYDQALELIKELVAESQKEDGCIIYDVYKDMDNELGLCIFEKWEDEESLEKHMNSEHFKRLVPKIGALAEEKTPIFKFTAMEKKDV